jgi:exonuclease SbcC
VDGLRDRSERLRVALDDKRRDRDVLKERTAALPTIESALREVEPKLGIVAKAAPAGAVAAQAIALLTDTAAALQTKTTAHTAVLAELLQLGGLEREVGELGIQVTKQSNALQRSESELGALERSLGVAQAELARIEDTVQMLERLRTDIVPLQVDLDDWTLIAKSQSSTGIPALKVDRALPEIGTRATELLRECLGQVIFTIQLVTQKASADDKKLLETLDILILRNGKIMDAALLSGGEGVLVSEALALSIALYIADRGKRSYTLFRDEVGAALDIDVAPAYTRLLARAAKIGGFDKILFVSHHDRALALADARLKFADGTITVS